jgi:hypothetical protein
MGEAIIDVSEGDRGEFIERREFFLTSTTIGFICDLIEFA